MYIFFDETDAQAFSKSFELDTNLSGETFVLKDDWSIGPVGELQGVEGMGEARNEWLSKIYQGNAPDAESDLQKITEWLEQHPDEQAWMWIAPNSRDVAGYYFLISRMEAFKGRLSTVWLNNLPFISDKGNVFYPSYLHEIPAKEFLKARKLAVEISPATFETDPDEWKKLTAENGYLRILDGGKKLISKKEDYFDREILLYLPGDFQKVSRIIANIQSKTKSYLNRSFLLWRVRELINMGKISANGEWAAQDNFEVKKLQADQNAENHE